MARPAEKARAMLNKWVKMREEGNSSEITSGRGKRPKLASECVHLSDAEYYRNQIIKEITGMVAKIQNPALGEHTIRDLNDEINRKMREKHHWNKRIIELGGVDYIAIERERQIAEGDDQYLHTVTGGGPAGSSFYRYFGAAKDLPGVKELFEKRVQKLQARKRGDIEKHITSSYFGWREEEDGVLLELESKAFLELQRQNQQSNKRQKTTASTSIDLNTLVTSPYGQLRPGDTNDYLDVPSQEEISKILLEEKKKALLSKFSI